jgi:tetratricopeptide (TPR) repeat protein
MTRILLAALTLTLALCAQPARRQTRTEPYTVTGCEQLVKHGERAEAHACFEALTKSPDAYLRAEGFWGIQNFQEANNQFKAAVAEHPQNPQYRVRWGRLFLERFNNGEATNLFQEALEIQKDYAPAYLGLALVFSDGFSPKAVEFAQKAIEADPKLLEAQELLAYLALEDSDTDKAIKEADKAIAMSPEALDALSIRATMDFLNDKSSSEWMDRILKVNPTYGQAYATAGHFFVINRRYVEGIAEYRKAIDLDPQLWEAHAQLGVNLMRLGEEAEPRKELELCYTNHYTSLEVDNSLKLLDSYKNYETFRTPTTIIRLHKKEAALLYPYFQSELDRAIATYEKKYQLKLTVPVQLEVYPDHEDFAVRTTGVPGLGALGVTFGTVVAMDSPSGRKPGDFHWASTLWHEMSHVYVLTATKHRVPRWFTEGLAVYEETATSPDWGDRLDPEAIGAIQNNKLLPVAELDRGFVRPSYPMQVIVSYFQAGQICGYIAQKWGYSKLLEMVHSFGDLKTTPQVIQEDLKMSPEEFDKEFLAWLKENTKVQVEHLAEWKHSVKELGADLKAQRYDQVIENGTKIRDWYPDYVESGSVYQMLADAYQAKGDKKDAMLQLEKYSATGGRNSALVKRLASLEQEAGENQKAAATLERLNYIYPEDEDLHRRLGDLLLAQNKIPGAIREYQAVLAMKPLDQASAHYELAKALKVAQRPDDAREQVLEALEAAPGYKPAQQLLLELAK